jgi:predicted PurR-regulated permease PerM
MSDSTDLTTNAALRPAPVAPWILIGLTAVAVYACWPRWPALVLAAWTSALASPLLARFERRLHGTRRAAAALSLLLFTVLALPLVAIALGVISGAQDLARLLAEQPSAKGALESIATGPQTPGPLLPRDLASALELFERHGAQGVTLLKNLAGAAVGGVVSLLIYFGGAYAFLIHGPEVWAWMRAHSPLPPRHLERLSAAFHETGHGLLVGVGLTSATQGVIATLVYLSLGVPRWWVLGPLTGLSSIIPLVGSALIWGPLAAGFFLGDHVGKALILLVLGLGVISTADNLLRPVYARVGSLHMPTFLLFVALLGGLSAFGTWGAVLGPLVVRLWLEALALQREATRPLSQDAVTALEK